MKLDIVNVSCIKCIGYYRNSSRGCQGMHLQLVPGLLYSRNSSYFLTLSGPAFSVVHQARGAQRPGCQKSQLTSTD